MIRISPIRLVGPEGEQIGVVDTQEAIRMAQEAGLDLVEVVPDSRPPVCKIMDYGKFRYEQSKQSKNKGAKANEIKEIRLGRSIKIDPHDVSIRVDQARRFLMAGHKVQFQQRYRGREMAFRGLGDQKLYQVVRDLADVSKVERAPITQGKQVTLVLAPDKVKIDAIKRKLAAEGKQQEEDDLEALEAQVAAQNLADSADDEPDDDAAEGDAKQDKKGKGKKDNRIKDPVNDEVADLLGG